MTITTMREKIDFSALPGIAVFIFICIGTYAAYKNVKAYDAKMTNIRCPSLLSIGRSSRDTLIIMKMEPSCNQYVLDNLK